VLDEADEMLSMGFIEDIEAILLATPAERQTALFSATVPPEIRRLAERYLREPEAISIQREQVTVAAIEQRHYVVYEAGEAGGADAALRGRADHQRADLCAHACRRRRAGRRTLHARLPRRGVERRTGAGRARARDEPLPPHLIKVLVATDVAARGLDIDHISHVFNFDLPEDPEVYVHRIGRTGRAGKSGIALSLVTPNERWRVGRIEGFIKTAIRRATIPTDRGDSRRAARPNCSNAWAPGCCRGGWDRNARLVNTLVDAGHDPIEIAAAALRLVRGDEDAAPDPDRQPKCRSAGRSASSGGPSRARSTAAFRPPLTSLRIASLPTTAASTASRAAAANGRAEKPAWSACRSAGARCTACARRMS
jgi:ATP-dependent RNA helicase DeaD